ncbi:MULTISPECIES: nuclease-related domain-containing protein [unclassified Sporosarcina]|uniref:nuclease-related domain-containing protein n=1 Tax=unclassified Sporosarcina TaxID=2647733 RepID=UPI00203C1445|nr:MULTISPECIES: nuclease-related domain-containing protein [unclassified Sporosarcina]GKV66245.1 nuclease [Sporosarcina sp. NCCP-2331]GLB56282.1 nuclease [Sporosarcina sp. NCCP-2378]
MIYKTREMPRVMIGQHALLKRLPSAHPKYEKVRMDFYNGKAGFGGEKEFDYHLREFVPCYPHAILHDLYLKYDQFYFQIDSLLITPSVIVLFEIKNIAGKLHIKQNPTQFIRESAAGERTVLRSPIEELERKKYFLRNWLAQRKVDIPIIDYVVFAYHNELNIENMEAHRIVFSYEVPNKLRALEMDTAILNERQVQHLASELAKSHRVFDPLPMKQKYDLASEELMTGVTCQVCDRFSMQWRMRTWQCQTCGYKDPLCHLNTLQEWLCIEGGQVTNQQFRQFSRISSRHTAKRLLTNEFTELHGKNRTSTYQLSSRLLSIPAKLPF